ncbi:MAG: hypothetical protein ABIQ31_16575 [Ferruginibacter sp.]
MFAQYPPVQLLDPFPFAMITSPGDYRLMRNKNQLVGNNTGIAAIVFGMRSSDKVFCRAENSRPAEMQLDKEKNIFTATVELPDQDLIDIAVEAFDETGRPGKHSLQAATASYIIKERIQDGSDAASIGGWPENGIFGTQLGPNRNAKRLHKPKPPEKV